MMIMVVDACPNECSGHGICSIDEWDTTWMDVSDSCDCFFGWTGSDCSLRQCPSGQKAWYGNNPETGNPSPHVTLQECSNMGHCDRSTGLCKCRSGFTGSACDRLRCPHSADGEVCNNKGRCMSMSEAASEIDYVSLWKETTYTTEWDAEMIFGCVCDEGWEGFDCTQRSCPTGPEVFPLGATPVNEVVLIDCTCQATCSGSFTVTFRGQSVSIPYDATIEYLDILMESLSTIEGVTVAFTGGINVCDADGVTTTMTFTHQHGNLEDVTVAMGTLASDSGTNPVLTAFLSGTASTLNTGIASVTGTKAKLSCSGRGTCSLTTGDCYCFNEFLSSDRSGGLGGYNDCAYYNAGTFTGSCPVAVSEANIAGKGYDSWSTLKGSICGGNAVDETVACTAGTGYQCNCVTSAESQTEGFGCEKFVRTTGTAWFDEASTTNTAHATATCSNQGLVDQSNGDCVCDPLFTNSACNRMACPVGNNPLGGGDQPCSGQGTCLLVAAAYPFSRNWQDTMLGGTYNSSWESQMLTTCHCDKTPAVDGMYYKITEWANYRGPETYAWTDSIGYDCSRAKCPTGDNPLTIGYKEQQTITCTHTSGKFRLKFRNERSAWITFDETLSNLEMHLESMDSIGDVTATAASITTVCDASAAAVTITFDSDFGDIPILEVSGTTLAGGAITIAQSRVGSKENSECSQNGICDETTGRCKCNQNFQSSNGDNKFGGRGDCGFRNVWSETGVRKKVIE